MSVNTGGIYTPAASLPRREDEQINTNVQAAGAQQLNNMNINPQQIANMQQQLLLQQQLANTINQQQNIHMSSNDVNLAISSLFQNPLVASGAIQLPQFNAITQQNNMGGIVQQQQQGVVNNVVSNNTATSGFGSFFFNPLAMFTGNTANQLQAQPPQVISHTNYQQQQTPTTQQINTATPGHITAASMLNSDAALGQAINQQHTMNVDPRQQPLTTPATPALGFMTPSQTPCPTPPPPKSPMFHDANSVAPPLDGFSLISSSKVQSRGTKVTPPPGDTASSKSLFQRGVSSILGSALGSVASYVSQSFQSGIPYAEADKAMRESKSSYAKWWEQGIDDHKKRKGSGVKEDEENTSPAGKKRKLDSDNAFDCAGSALSSLLKKHYDEMGVDTNCGFHEAHQYHYQNNIDEQQLAQQQPVVDSSIISCKRKTRQRADSADGYDAFNDVGGMYDFGGADAGEMPDSGAAKEGDTYEALYNDVSSGPSSSIVPETQLPENDTTTTANTTTITSDSTLDGTMQVIQELLQEKNRASEENEMLQMIRNPRDWVKKSIRSEMIESLQAVKGDVTDKRFLSSLEILKNFYKGSGRDARVSPWALSGGPTEYDILEGHYVNMSRPDYIECLGHNGEDDFMYTLGRMSFDMFQPGNLICSVQSTHNTIKIIGEQEELPEHVPKSLKEEVASLHDKRPLLRSYDIAVSLTIEPPSSVGQPETPDMPTPTKRMRAIMSVKGYILPDPDVPNRLTVWFTGGNLCPARLPSSDGNESDDDDEAKDDDSYGGFAEWKAIFSKGKWRKTLGERARAIASKLLLGADVSTKMVESTGDMSYVLHKPVGGHGKAYIDVLYLDEDVLIMKGHHGTVYALARSGVSQRYKAMREKEDDNDKE